MIPERWLRKNLLIAPLGNIQALFRNGLRGAGCECGNVPEWRVCRAMSCFFLIGRRGGHAANVGGSGEFPSPAVAVCRGGFRSPVRRLARGLAGECGKARGERGRDARRAAGWAIGQLAALLR